MRRYERERPGELIHIDINKHGLFEQVGHRTTGDRTGQSKGRGVGWDFVRVCIDDASRVAFSQILPDERKESAVAFLKAAIGGATVAHRLDAYLSRTLGTGFQGIGRVLDWGCGCARVMRYIGAWTKDVEGADVDELNVAWCNENLPNLTVAQIGLMPHTPFETSRFDLVFGISVMTHLREPAQDAWLNELSRIVRPGGYVAVSIMGSVNQCIGLQSGKKMAETLERGLYITDQSNDQIQKDMDGESYYVNVAHAPWYVFNHWTRVSPFEVVDIAPGLVTSQDLVLLRNVK